MPRGTTPAPPTNFYPRPPRGGRPVVFSALPALAEFLSTPSARRATCWASTPWNMRVFLSTPSARRATKVTQLYDHFSKISIHALREEGDLNAAQSAKRGSYFYPRPPRGGRPRPRWGSPPDKRISIHALREEGDYNGGRAGGMSPISIHALREEGDSCTWASLSRQQIFLSTPSARRATLLWYYQSQNCLFLSTPSARRATWRPSP